MVLTPYKLNEVVDIPHLILNMKHQKNQTAIGNHSVSVIFVIIQTTGFLK